MSSLIRLTHRDDEDTFVKRADDGLYLAKHRGRNQVATMKTTDFAPLPPLTIPNGWNQGLSERQEEG